MSLPISPAFTIKHDKLRGRGLFATTPILAHTTIHTAPCLRFTKNSYDEHAKHTILEHYLFNLKNGDKLLALGSE
jgi:hypothetical protein